MTCQKLGTDLTFDYCGLRFPWLPCGKRSNNFQNQIKEIRSVDDHCIVVWSNLTTVGVMPAAKLDFFLTAISNILASHKRNALAILIHPNRASDTGRMGFDNYINVFMAIINFKSFFLINGAMAIYKTIF